MKNRVLRINYELIESKRWRRLSLIQTSEVNHECLEDGVKYVLEQKIDAGDMKKSVKFNKLVEVFELRSVRQKVMTKADELSSIAMDLKKDCGIIENALKPSSNLFKVPEKFQHVRHSLPNTCMHKVREASWGTNAISIPKLRQPIKIRSLTRALTYASQIGAGQKLRVPLRKKLELKSKLNILK